VRLLLYFVLQDITSRVSAVDLSYIEAILPTTNVSNNKLHGTFPQIVTANAI
jgi:hypothetical protein